MKISEFIKWLENNKELHGDLEMMSWNCDVFDDFNPDNVLTTYITDGEKYLMCTN